MIRSLEFYQKKYGWNDSKINKLYKVLCDAENGIYDVNFIRDNSENITLMCICESKVDLLCKLMSPISYDDNGVIRYRYLIDYFTLEDNRIFEGFFSLISEAWAVANENERSRAMLDGGDCKFVPIEEVARDAVLLSNYDKNRLENIAYNLDYDKIMSMKIEDVLARQISGVEHPIQSEKDVIKYSEVSVVYPSIELYRKNIITTANDTVGCYNDKSEDGKGSVVINLDYDSLDDYNKEVARMLVSEGLAEYYVSSFGQVKSYKWLDLKVNCSTSDTVLDVNKSLMKIISKFHKQDMIYGRVTSDYVLGCMSKSSRYLSDEDYESVLKILGTDCDDDALVEALGYFRFLGFYYDEEEQQFWANPYYYFKHKNYLLEQDNFGGPSF